MLSQKILLVLVIISFIAFLGVLIWRIVYTSKNKGDEKALNALTKAMALSSYTPFGLMIFWTAVASFIFKDDTVFTMNNIGTFTMILIGIQSAIELFAGYYYTKTAKN